MDHGVQTDEEEAQFTNGSHKIRPMELTNGHDEEYDSLMMETAAGSDVGRMSFLAKHQLKLRRKHISSSAENTTRLGVVQGFLRGGIGNHFSLRNLLLLSLLAVVIMMWTGMLEWKLETIPEDGKKQVKSPHETSFGGSKNTGHYHYHDDDDPSSWTDEDLPTSNLGFAVQSIGVDNLKNANGHYLHDPFKSPFASLLYKSNNDNETARLELQAEFQREMSAIRTKFGVWLKPNYTNPDLVVDVEFDDIPYRDMAGPEFPTYAWQIDEAYVKHFLSQAKALIARVKEGIYLEYGLGVDPQVDEAQKEKQRQAFQVITADVKVDEQGFAVDQNDKRLPGAAFLNQQAYDALVRKLLHAMITNDIFYVVAVGSESTYAVNNFFQSQIMQFNYIMEPVFDKLGMTLVSRNMGMQASTTVSALGGSDIYGESDILWYIADTREGVQPESNGQLDLLFKQAILSGERVPIILTPNPLNLVRDSNGNAWIGNVQPGSEFCEATRTDKDGLHLPSVEACQYISCPDDSKSTCNKYNSVCWVDRSDWNPSDSKKSLGTVPSGMPNPQQHRLDGRKLAMLVLQALDEALNRWSLESDAGNFPPTDNLWHVGSAYQTVRDNVRSLERTPGTSARVPDCELLLRALDPMICHMSMHAITEWTPRMYSVRKSIAEMVKVPFAKENGDYRELYQNIDLFPPQWKPTGIDVHMISMATSGDFVTDMSDSNVLDHDPYYEDNSFFAFDDDSDDSWRSRELSHQERESSVSEPKKRSLVSSSIDSQWVLRGSPIGYCDGSAQSHCNRAIGNNCLLANHNHYKGGFVGQAGTGWLNMSIPYIKEGIVLARLTSPSGALLDLNNLPSGFLFDFTVNQDLTSLSRDDFVELGFELADDLILYPLLIDRAMSHSNEVETMDIGLRVRKQSQDSDSVEIMLTHLYYA